MNKIVNSIVSVVQAVLGVLGLVIKVQQAAYDGLQTMLEKLKME